MSDGVPGDPDPDLTASSVARPAKGARTRQTWVILAVLLLVIGGVALTRSDDGEPAAHTANLPATAPHPGDEAAIQADLDAFSDAYNSGDFIGASWYVSADMTRECGGATATAFALSQNAGVTKSNVRVMGVTAYEDSTLVDIELRQSYPDAPELTTTVGYEVTHENGVWRVADDLLPPGASAFCE